MKNRPKAPADAVRDYVLGVESIARDIFVRTATSHSYAQSLAGFLGAHAHDTAVEALPAVADACFEIAKVFVAAHERYVEASDG